MKQFGLIVLISLFSLVKIEATENLIGTPIHECVKCLCHARSGCWSRINCARYSISFDYWKRAGSPVVEPSDDPNSEASYKKCIADENCIVNAISKYVKSFGELDCNCDGNFDCKDWFAIHLNGNDCANPKFGHRYARRFNQCAKSVGVETMETEEGSDTCSTEVEVQ